MADSDTEITQAELQKEIAEILKNASLDKTSTKKVIQKLEQKLGVDLTEKKKLIDQLVMDYVNSIDSDEEESEEEEEPPKKKPAVRKAKKQDDDEDEEEHDDSNDSDWGCHRHLRHHLDEHLLHGYSDESCHPLPQESTISTTGIQGSLPRLPKKTFILQRVAPSREDEADIFGKLIAKKLRKLSDRQRDSLMLEINKLFYNKCYKPASPPKRKMEDKATSTLPAIQCNVKELFRITGMPTPVNNVPVVATPITVADFSLPIETLTGMPKPVPKTDVPPSNVPEPVVQEAATCKPSNNENTGYKCDLM